MINCLRRYYTTSLSTFQTERKKLATRKYLMDTKERLRTFLIEGFNEQTICCRGTNSLRCRWNYCGGLQPPRRQRLRKGFPASAVDTPSPVCRVLRCKRERVLSRTEHRPHDQAGRNWVQRTNFSCAGEGRLRHLGC